jgi:RNA polymerase sigma factor (sigma-70 family)
VRPGDLERLEVAYRRHGGDLWRAIYAFSGGSSDTADETVAEAFAQAARAISGIRDLRPWLYRAAFRIAAGTMGATRRRGDQALDHVDVPVVQGTEDIELNELTRQLTPTQRKAFVLREVLGFSSSETAGLLGTSQVAVRVHVHAARTRLRAMYQEVEP